MSVKHMKMEKPATHEDQDTLVQTISELTVRLAEMEKIMRGQALKEENTDSTAALDQKVSPEISTKSTQTLTSTIPEAPYSPEYNYMHSYLRNMVASLSIPGIKFIGEKYRPRLHSYLWVMIHIVSLLISFVFIKDEYINWKTSPIVIAISNKVTYVNEVPFPAITVCLPGSVKTGYDYAGSVDKCILCNRSLSPSGCIFNEDCSYEEKASIAVASLVCPYRKLGLDVTTPWELFMAHMKSIMEGSEFLNFSKNTFPQCDVKTYQMRYIAGKVKYPLQSYFGCTKNDYLKFVSSFGMCFTMNGLREKDIFKESTVVTSEETLSNGNQYKEEELYKGKGFTLENMMYSNGDITTIPVYASDSHQITFYFWGRHNKESAKLCKAKGPDVKDAYFAIHSPFEVPFIFTSDFDIKHGEAKELKIMPKITMTEKSLGSYTPVERGCFYSFERELVMFKHYSESNCQIECIANCALLLCKCVPYYLPRHNSSVSVCLTDCHEASFCDRQECNCLPDCFAISYSIESENGVDETSQVASVNIKYKNGFVNPNIRVGLTNFAQFVAYCLGILGVFNGFSVIVIFEILYFITFRLWHSIKSRL